MNSYRYVDGKLALFDAPDRPVVWFPLASMPKWFPPAPRDARERRRWARLRTRGRRAARRVKPPEAQPYVPIREVVRLTAHRFTDGKRAALIYLPDGESPTEQHGRDLDRALR